MFFSTAWKHQPRADFRGQMSVNPLCKLCVCLCACVCARAQLGKLFLICQFHHERWLVSLVAMQCHWNAFLIFSQHAVCVCVCVCVCVHARTLNWSVCLLICQFHHKCWFVSLVVPQCHLKVCYFSQYADKNNIKEYNRSYAVMPQLPVSHLNCYDKKLSCIIWLFCIN